MQRHAVLSRDLDRVPPVIILAAPEIRFAEIPPATTEQTHELLHRSIFQAAAGSSSQHLQSESFPDSLTFRAPDEKAPAGIERGLACKAAIPSQM